MNNESFYEDRMSNESRGSDSRSLLHNIRDYSSRKLSSFKKKITNNFNEKLNFLTTIAFAITLIIMLVIIFFSGFINDNPLYFSLIQYISIGIFFILFMSYYGLAYFWLRNKEKKN